MEIVALAQSSQKKKEQIRDDLKRIENPSTPETRKNTHKFNIKNSKAEGKIEKKNKRFLTTIRVTI